MRLITAEILHATEIHLFQTWFLINYCFIIKFSIAKMVYTLYLILIFCSDLIPITWFYTPRQRTTQCKFPFSKHFIVPHYRFLHDSSFRVTVTHFIFSSILFNIVCAERRTASMLCDCSRSFVRSTNTLTNANEVCGVLTVLRYGCCVHYGISISVIFCACTYSNITKCASAEKTPTTIADRKAAYFYIVFQLHHFTV